MATCYIAAEKRVRSLNFMSRIPRKFPLDKLERREQILRGPVAVGAPGNPRRLVRNGEHLRHQEANRNCSRRRSASPATASA